MNQTKVYDCFSNARIPNTHALLQIRASVVCDNDISARTGLKKVYTAINAKIAVEELEKFKTKWSAKYKYAITSWEENWDNLSNYFEYPLELRRIIYTTNTIENLNRGIRKYTKTKTQFVNENAATKSIYLSIQNIEKAWAKPITNWGLILNQFSVIFDKRCKL